MENKKETILFVLITFLITWSCWGTLAFTGMNATGSPLVLALYMLGGFAAGISALILPLFTGKDRRREYYKRYFRFKVNPKWYIIPFAAVLPIVYCSYAVVAVFFSEAAEKLMIQPVYMFVPLFFGMIFGGGVEEFGWRGIMVHNMRKMNPWIIGLAVGLIWSVWHLPLFYIKGVSQYGTSFPAFLIMVLGLSFITTILYLQSQSVIPCLIFHAAWNAYTALGFQYGPEYTGAVYTNSVVRLLVALAIFVVIKANSFKIGSAASGEM